MDSIERNGNFKDKKENTITKRIKTLVSDFYQPPKEFLSVFDCKKKEKKRNQFLVQGENEIRIKAGYNGPLIVIHRELNKKVLPKKRKNTFTESEYVKPFTYFKDHSKCPEVEMYWHPHNPKILRHYSPEKTKRKF